LPTGRALYTSCFRLSNRRDQAGADGATSLTQRESHPRLDANLLSQLETNASPVAWMYQRPVTRNLDGTGDIRCSEEELRRVAGFERSVTPAFFGAEHVKLGLPRGKLPPHARQGHDLATNHLVPSDAT